MKRLFQRLASRPRGAKIARGRARSQGALPQLGVRPWGVGSAGPAARTVCALLCAAGSLVALGTTGCGVGRGDMRWIGDDSAFVACVIAGRNRSVSALAAELPVPTPPTGLYARALDPIALDDLGYQRDSPVCATLEAPTRDEISASRAAIERFNTARRSAQIAARSEGACFCEALARAGKRGLFSHCVGKPTKRECDLTPELQAKVEALVAPLHEAISKAHVPLLHWRLVGIADRPDRFLARRSELISLHSRGSQIYERGAPVIRRGNHALLEALLEHEDVIAVVRQDSGHALLVMRVVDGDRLVLDHFSYPEMGPRLQPLLAYLDNTQIDRYLRALDRPAAPRKLSYDPREGTVFEVDADGLGRIDEALVVATTIGGGGYKQAREAREIPPLLFDRAGILVSRAETGDGAVAGVSEQLHATLRLTDEGEAWVEKMGTQEVFMALGDLGELAEDDVTPSLRLAGLDPGFVLRGTQVERSLFFGLNALPAVLAAIEGAQSGSVQGTVERWSATIPSGPLPGEISTAPGLQRLRERLSKHPHRLEVTREAGSLGLQLTPK